MRHCFRTALLLLSLSGTTAFAQEPKITTVLEGPSSIPSTIILEYSQPISASSVSPETYVIPGVNIRGVFVTDSAPTADPLPPRTDGQKTEKNDGERPQMPPRPESVDGKYVVLLLEGGMGGRRGHGMRGGPGMPPPDGTVPERSDKAGQNDKAQSRSGAEKSQSGREGQGMRRMGPGGPQGQRGMRPPMEGSSTPKTPILIQQVKDITTVSGNALKAWKESREADNFIKREMPPRDREGQEGGRGRGPRQSSSMTTSKA